MSIKKEKRYEFRKRMRCIHKENRLSQEQFICIECGNKMNADHNASINIAKSEEFIK